MKSGVKKSFNEHVVDGERTTIYVKNRLKETMECYIDTKNLHKFLELGFSWHTYWNKVNNTYYARCASYYYDIDGKRKCKMIYMHHFIKPIKEGEVIDHRDNNELNNCEDNLRVTTQDKNLQNRTTKNKNNKSGYRNVSWIEADKSYIVQLQVNGKNTRLGSFKDVHKAGKFAAEMRIKHYGEFRGNA